MEFTSLQQVRDFIASVPKEKFCRYALYNGCDEMCVAGHLNKAIFGDPGHGWDMEQDNYALARKLSPFGIDVLELVYFNNTDKESPKRGALKYLDSLLAKN